MNECPRILLSCFRARNSVVNPTHLIQDGRRLVAVERSAVAPSYAGEGGGGGGALRREDRRESAGGDAILQPRQQDPRQGRPGGCAVNKLLGGASTCSGGFVNCFLRVPFACLGSMAAVVQPNNLGNSQKTVYKTFGKSGRPTQYEAGAILEAGAMLKKHSQSSN